jgi:hypothetical protein
MMEGAPQFASAAGVVGDQIARVVAGVGDVAAAAAGDANLAQDLGALLQEEHRRPVILTPGGYRGEEPGGTSADDDVHHDPRRVVRAVERDYPVPSSSQNSRTSARRRTAMPPVGKKAPAFTLPNQDGKKIKLADFKGKTLLLFAYPKAATSG